MVELLLKHGADPNLLHPDQGPSLVVATIHNRIDAIKLLLDYGADVNLTKPGFATSLGSACAKGYLDIARLLLDRGADVNAVDGIGNTPLISAVQSLVHKDVIQLLLERGADPSIADAFDRTALDCAIKDSEIAQMISNAQLKYILLTFIHTAYTCIYLF